MLARTVGRSGVNMLPSQEAEELLVCSAGGRVSSPRRDH